MRATLTPLSRGLAVAAAAVLLTACSGDDGGDDAAESSTATTSAAPSSEPEEEAPGDEAPEADSEFCTQSQELLDGLGAAFTDQADPRSVEGAFEQAAEGFRSVEPPAAIEGDWAALGDGLESYAAAFAELDETDPQSVAEFQQRTSSLQGELTAAATNVESYLNEECGIDTEQDATESSAPTS